MQSQQVQTAGHLGIEDVLCSKTRMKILSVLVGSQLTSSEIAKSVGVNYASAAKHLELLEAEGILEHINFGYVSGITSSMRLLPRRMRYVS